LVTSEFFSNQTFFQFDLQAKMADDPAGEPVDEDMTEDIFHDAAADPADVLLSSIRDSIVSHRTRSCYTSEIFCILFWLRNQQHQVLTAHGKHLMDSKIDKYPELDARQLYKKIRDTFLEELREANSKKNFVEDFFTADIYMDYLRGQRNLRTRSYLSKSAYGVKRAALYHLFRLQNGSGYPDPFKNALNNLLRGFFRVLTSRKSTAKQQIREQQLGGEIVTNANNVLSQWNQVSLFLFLFS
jgi:hypothetical protein